MLDIERQFFEENRESLALQYPGKFLVIKEREVVGAFDDMNDALSEGTRTFGLTSFLVRNVNETRSEISIPALTLGLLSADTHF
jgi:hypothetical protein